MLLLPTSSPLRLRNGTLRLVAQVVTTLLLSFVACLSLSHESERDDGAPSPSVAQECECHADSHDDGHETHFRPQLLIARPALRVPHRPSSLGERETITVRAQGPPVFNILA